MRKTRDPITGFKDKIVTAGLVTEDELKEVDKEIRKEVGSFLLLFAWMFILSGTVGSRLGAMKG